MMRIIIIVCMVLAFLAGCSGPKRMATRAEWLQKTSRHFPGKSVEEVFAAAEKVCLLADGDDFEFAHQPNRMIATRHWSGFFIFSSATGTHTFDLVAAPGQDGSDARLLISSQTQTFTATPTYTPGVTGGANGVGAAGTSSGASGAGWPFEQPYLLFWDRMESILYGSTPWTSCKAYGHIYSENSWGEVVLEPLCLFSDDGFPDGIPISDAEIEYRKKVADDKLLAAENKRY